MNNNENNNEMSEILKWAKEVKSLIVDKFLEVKDPDGVRWKGPVGLLVGYAMRLATSVLEQEKKLEKYEIETEKGMWQIYKRGDEILIADPEGRCRHRSKGHHNTSVFLAMEMNRNKFTSVPNLDEALKNATERFINGE